MNISWTRCLGRGGLVYGEGNGSQARRPGATSAGNTFPKEFFSSGGQAVRELRPANLRAVRERQHARLPGSGEKARSLRELPRQEEAAEEQERQEGGVTAPSYMIGRIRMRMLGSATHDRVGHLSNKRVELGDGEPPAVG